MSLADALVKEARWQSQQRLRRLKAVREEESRTARQQAERARMRTTWQQRADLE